jgi:DNA-binding CsgD family transcriptional regulator
LTSDASERFMESAYQRDRASIRLQDAAHGEVTDVTQARHEVRTRRAASQPAIDRRQQLPPTVEVLEPRDAIRIGGAGTMIRAFTRLTTQQATASTAEPETAEVAGPVHSRNGDDGTGVSDPPVTTEELAILTLMANGLTLDSVAIRLSMSPRTLSRRLRCVCDRLQVTYPIQAIVWAARRGLI